MKTEKHRNKLLGGILAALVLTCSLAATVSAQLAGAIFTTDAGGNFVNANIYDLMDDVYLNGGPRSPKAPCTAAGLPDGFYAFQVTDPSGQVLLSTDGIEQRIVEVRSGVIVKNWGTHFVGVGKCNSVTVQLSPFNITPNPGGEYKVWMAPINLRADGTFLFQGFLPNQSKTDNFKIAECIPDETNNCGVPTE